MKPICIIPARAGSKRVPGKNMRPLGGKPLVQWIIEAALRSNIFEYVVVSSDDKNVLRLAEGYAGVRAAQRPSELSGDNIRAEEVFAYHSKNFLGEIVCMAMPTAPFTQPSSLARAYKKMIAEPRYGGMMLAVKTPFNTIRTVTLQDEYIDSHEGECWESQSEDLNSCGCSPQIVESVADPGSWSLMGMQSQDLPETYRPTYGGMFIKTDLLLGSGSPWSESPSYYAGSEGLVVVESHEGIDIDTEADWKEAERWLTTQQQD